jgi:hypothetical protein
MHDEHNEPHTSQASEDLLGVVTDETSETALNPEVLDILPSIEQDTQTQEEV